MKILGRNGKGGVDTDADNGVEVPTVPDTDNQ